jgi:hypothetical protein
MKLTTLETLFSGFIDDLIAAENSAEEIELGFDTMLSADMVEFLKAERKPLGKKSAAKQHKPCLDEYELAMT